MAFNLHVRERGGQLQAKHTHTNHAYNYARMRARVAKQMPFEIVSTLVSACCVCVYGWAAVCSNNFILTYAHNNWDACAIASRRSIWFVHMRAYVLQSCRKKAFSQNTKSHTHKLTEQRTRSASIMSIISTTPRSPSIQFARAAFAFYLCVRWVRFHGKIDIQHIKYNSWTARVMVNKYSEIIDTLNQQYFLKTSNIELYIIRRSLIVHNI